MEHTEIKKNRFHFGTIYPSKNVLNIFFRFQQAGYIKKAENRMFND